MLNSIINTVTSSLWRKILVLVGSFLLSLLVFILIWASYRGFEFSDESYYNIGYYFHTEIDNPIIFFHRIYNRFFGFLSLSLAQNRVLGIVLLLFSSFFVAHASILYFNIKEKVLFSVFVAILGFLSYAIFPMSISYNLLSAIFTAVLVGLTFLFLVKEKKRYAFFIGFFIALMVANKFTNIAFIGYFFLVTFLIDRVKNKRANTFYLTPILWVILGMGLGIYILFPSWTELKLKAQEFVFGMSLTTAHSLASMFEKIWLDVRYLLLQSIYLLPTFIVLFLVRKHKKNGVYYLFLIGIATLNFIYILFHYYYFLGKTSIYILFFFVIILTIALLWEKNNLHKKRDYHLIYAFVLMLVPFVSSFGTNNSLFTQFTFYGNVFAVGLFLLLNNLKYIWLRYFLLSIIVFISTAQIIYNKIIFPYRITSPLTQQNIPITNIPYLKGIKVDAQTADYIQQILTLKNYSESTIFLCSKELGISIITEKEPLFFTWIDKNSYHLIPIYIKQQKDKLEKGSILVIPKKDKQKIPPYFLKEEKEGYTKVKEIIAPRDTLLIYRKKNAER